MKRILVAIVMVLVVRILFAQSIAVENFHHQKHYFWQLNSSLPLDKHNAVVLFKTEVKGFQFKTPGGAPIEFEEKDGGITLKVPHKTKYIIISHPEYGEMAWRVPEKFLKKHNYYSADLSVSDLTKENKNQNQWLVFNISPEKSLITIDSVMHRVDRGTISFYLPVGSHTFKVESPFYEAQEGSITLNDSIKEEKNIFLEPVYSYLTVACDDPETEIFIDEVRRGAGEATFGRINEGNHRISLLKGNQWVKDTIVYMAAAEKKSLNFSGGNKNKSISEKSEKFEKHPALNVYREKTEVKINPEKLLSTLPEKEDSVVYANVHLIAEDSLSRIRIDRELKGIGEWSGILEKGIHLVSTEKDGLESVAQYIEIESDFPVEINLAVPKTSVGTVNFLSNVTGAEIIYGKKIMGMTPQLIKDLAADENHTFVIYKEGYEEKTVSVRPKGNNITDIYVELKKK